MSKIDDKTEKKKKTKNFTAEEIKIIVEDVTDRMAVFFGPLRGPNLTQFHRDRAWEQVLAKVNAIAPCVRSVKEIRAKFKDFKNRTKTKANKAKREAQKTGGGTNESDPLSTSEQQILAFIGTESIEGITGGVDTFRKKVINKPGMSDNPNPLHNLSPSPAFDYSFSEILSQTSPGRLGNDSQDGLNNDTSPLPITPPRPTTPPRLPTALPGPNKKGRQVLKARRTAVKTLALDELSKSARIQDERNSLLRELIFEVRESNELKRRALDVQEKILDLKRTKYLSSN